MSKDVKDLSSEELKELLKQKEKEEKAERLERKKEYESTRDKMVRELITEAIELNKQMKAFKEKSRAKMEEFKQVAQEYGDVKSNSKGGFGLRSNDDQYKVVLERNTKTEYDERANQAEALLKEFLADKVKKKDLASYVTIEALLTRNRKTGQFNPVSINSLLAIEDNYDDERWNNAMRLFKESYKVIDVSMNVAFFEKDETGKDQSISLTFASL